MPKDYINIPINQPRRLDRTTNDLEIKSFLKKEAYCSIAHIYDGQPFIHTNIFYYDEVENAIYFHTAKAGRFRFNVESNSKVCFSVSKMGRFLPAKEAMHFSVEYEGVVVFGEIKIVNNTEKQKYALQKILDKYFPHLKADVDYHSTTAKELKLTTVYHLNIENMSGKKKEVKKDFPDAFFFGEYNGS